VSASLETISGWFDEGVRRKATHMVVVCDTYEYVDRPVYVMAGEEIREVVKKYNDLEHMSRVQEVYYLGSDKQAQLDVRPAFNYNPLPPRTVLEGRRGPSQAGEPAKILLQLSVQGSENVKHMGAFRLPDHLYLEVYDDGDVRVHTVGRVEAREVSILVERCREVAERHRGQVPARMLADKRATLVYRGRAPSAKAVQRIGYVRRPTYYRLTIWSDGQVSIWTAGMAVNDLARARLVTTCEKLGYVEDEAEEK